MPTQRKDYDIVGGYDNQRVSTISAQRTVNLFEYLDPQGKRPKTLLPTSGLRDTELVFSTETGGARASFVFKDAIYQVYGASVFKITGTTGVFVVTPIGSLTTTIGYVGIDANTFQVIFVDGEEGHIYDTNASTYERITDTGFPPNPIDVCFLDGFFLVAHGGTNEFQLSALNQGMVWSGGSATAATFTVNTTTDVLTLSTRNANFATGVPVVFSTTGPIPAPLVAGTTYYVIRIGLATTNPGTIKLATTYANAIMYPAPGSAIDLTSAGAPTMTLTVTGELQTGKITSHPGNIVACRTLHRRIFLFSANYTEVWENQGIGTNLPFRRNNSLLMEVGTPAIGSVLVGFDRMFFLSQDRDGLSGVMEVTGSQAILVSNRALDYQLAQYAENPLLGVDDARGVLIKENGLIFYRLNFTRANHTFVLNVSMTTQDTMRWHEEEVLNGDRHPAQTHAYFDGNNYYGAYDGPYFYLVDDQYSLNNEEAIRRMRIGREFTPEGYFRFRVDRFFLDLLQGQTAVGMDIEVDLTTESDDILLTENNQDIILEEEIDTGDGQPVVFLSVSKDGGQTYGFSLQGNMGKLGERTYRTMWRKLGTTKYGQGWIPKIEFFNEVPFVILGATWDIEVLPE